MNKIKKMYKQFERKVKFNIVCKYMETEGLDKMVMNGIEYTAVRNASGKVVGFGYKRVGGKQNDEISWLCAYCTVRCCSSEEVERRKGYGNQKPYSGKLTVW